ncbi:hypothetical protein K1719_002073 [Acacia pycnantha]|nr:hypothetical protein K1719_002073 [Acacia pycnantha]
MLLLGGPSDEKVEAVVDPGEKFSSFSIEPGVDGPSPSKFWSNANLDLDAEMVAEAQGASGGGLVVPASQVPCVSPVDSFVPKTQSPRVQISVTVLRKNRQLLHLLCVFQGSPPFLVSAVYAIPSARNKLLLWQELSSISQSNANPWVVVGDFNDIMASDERIGGDDINYPKIQCFQNRIQSCMLSDLGFRGPKFTWCGPRTGSRSVSSQRSIGSIPSLNSQSQRHHEIQPSTTTCHRCLTTLKGHTSSSSSSTSCLALSGKLLYTGSSDREIRSWNISVSFSDDSSNPEICITNIALSGKSAVKSIVVQSDKLFSAQQDHKIRVWKIISNNKTDQEEYTHVATLPTLGDRASKILIPKNHVQIRRHKKCTWVHHVNTVSALALSKDETLLYSVSWDRTVKIWRTRDFSCLESVISNDMIKPGLWVLFGEDLLVEPCLGLQTHEQFGPSTLGER